LLQLKDSGKLNPEMVKWFESTKPEEELYDLERDPYELNNLAKMNEFTEKRNQLRQKLDQWIMETRDLGQFSEDSLKQLWCPVPQLPDPIIMNDKIVSPDPHATLIWRNKGSEEWELYIPEMGVMKGAEIMAVRIGYEDSDALTIK
jgi:hypothetical protein